MIVKRQQIFQLFLIISVALSISDSGSDEWKKRACSSLQMGQFKCDAAKIDTEKQNEVNCTREGGVQVACRPAKGVICEEKTFNGEEIGFYVNIPCRYVTHYHYKTAVLLSIFLGMFGIDRFYLGYVAFGLLKFCTCGFMLIGYLIDMILIITQTLKPIDGSQYIVDYYGQVLYPSTAYNNYTFNLTYYYNLT